MKRRTGIWWAVIIIVVVVICGGAYYLRSDSGAVELTKTEALKLMDLQTRAVMAVADRDEFIQRLYLQYGIDAKTHQLNIATGQFIPAPPKEIKNEEVSSP